MLSLFPKCPKVLLRWPHSLGACPSAPRMAKDDPAQSASSLPCCALHLGGLTACDPHEVGAVSQSPRPQRSQPRAAPPRTRSPHSCTVKQTWPGRVSGQAGEVSAQSQPRTATVTEAPWRERINVGLQSGKGGSRQPFSVNNTVPVPSPSLGAFMSTAEGQCFELLGDLPQPQIGRIRGAQDRRERAGPFYRWDYQGGEVTCRESPGQSRAWGSVFPNGFCVPCVWSLCL